MSEKITKLTEEARNLVQDIEVIRENEPDNVELINSQLQRLKEVREEIFKLHEQQETGNTESNPDTQGSGDGYDPGDDDEPEEPDEDFDDEEEYDSDDDDSDEDDEDSDEDFDEDSDEDFDEDSDEDSDEDPDEDFDDDSDEDNDEDSDEDNDPDENDNPPEGQSNLNYVPDSTKELADDFQRSFQDMSLTKEQEKKIENTTMEDLKEEVKASGVCSTLTIYNSDGVEVGPLQKGEMFIADIPLELLHLPPAARMNLREVEDLEISFAEVGQIEPIHVIPFEASEGFIIVSGKRRFVAASNLSMRTIRAVVDTTRSKTWIRYLELVINSTRKPYNFKEIMTAGNFVNSKQPHLSTDVIDRLLGIPPGSFLEGKMLLIEPVDTEILMKLSMGKLSITQAYKALTKKREKEEKELEKLAAEQGLDLGDLRPVDYSDVDRTPNYQTTGDGRRPLERWLTEAIERRDNRTCQCCGLGHDEESYISCIYEKHHMIPVSKNGPDSEDNLILLCKNCHSIVHAIVDARFMPEKGREEEFHNHIVLAKIITDGPAGYTPFDRYQKEYINFWGTPTLIQEVQ
ncbi:ParB N-terminal domain-containing protein [Paenibacillus pabuli]|uniref:HNH endonuclease n=1 Tax=Paenibacillus pabuli TaxID=1472 RepID=UPI003241C94E